MSRVRYLDPKNDLTFRKVFGERPHLVKSFLNSVLPLEEGQLIESVEYLEPELIPELPSLKRSIVDVHCTDNHGRYFIVEMQMYWTSAFKKRMLFNTGKAYVRQLKGGGKYRDLKPVYGLSLVDDIFHTTEELQSTWYHHYRMVHSQQSNEKIEGLELIFIELPKFKAQNFTDKRLQTLWLRFLTEIDESTADVPAEMNEVQEIREALDCVNQSAFSEEEMLYYDQYWDAIRIEKAALEELSELNKKLIDEKAEEQRLREEERLMKEEERRLKEEERRLKEEERRLKEEERRLKEESLIKLARKMKKYGESVDDIRKETGLSAELIENL